MSAQGLPIDQLLKVMKQTAGRDKFYRFLVYFSKFLLWRLENNQGDKETIKMIDSASKNVSTSRKR